MIENINKSLVASNSTSDPLIIYVISNERPYLQFFLIVRLLIEVFDTDIEYDGCVFTTDLLV